jgi:hypothetical protein
MVTEQGQATRRAEFCDLSESSRPKPRPYPDYAAPG